MVYVYVFTVALLLGYNYLLSLQDLEASPHTLQKALLFHRFIEFILRVQILPHARIEIYLMASPPSCLLPQLVRKEDDAKQGEEDICVYKSSGIEGG
jgi:hypothetical protein